MPFKGIVFGKYSFQDNLKKFFDKWFIIFITSRKIFASVDKSTGDAFLLLELSGGKTKSFTRKSGVWLDIAPPSADALMEDFISVSDKEALKLFQEAIQQKNIIFGK